MGEGSIIHSHWTWQSNTAYSQQVLKVSTPLLRSNATQWVDSDMLHCDTHGFHVVGHVTFGWSGLRWLFQITCKTHACLENWMHDVRGFIPIQLHGMRTFATEIFSNIEGRENDLLLITVQVLTIRSIKVFHIEELKIRSIFIVIGHNSDHLWESYGEKWKKKILASFPNVWAEVTRSRIFMFSFR